MKKNFNLSLKEQDEIVPQLLSILTDKPKTNRQLISELLFLGIETNAIRVRAMIHYIRIKELAPVISNSLGYYISYDPVEVFSYCNSMELRAKSIAYASTGLRQFIRSHYTK